MGSPEDVLKAALALFIERNDVYKDGYRDVGELLGALFPDGVNIKSPSDLARLRLFIGMAVKMQRYAKNFDKGHPDSLYDLIVYTAMLQSLDNPGSK